MILCLRIEITEYVQNRNISLINAEVKVQVSRWTHFSWILLVGLCFMIFSQISIKRITLINMMKYGVIKFLLIVLLSFISKWELALKLYLLDDLHFVIDWFDPGFKNLYCIYTMYLCICYMTLSRFKISTLVYIGQQCMWIL